MTGFKNRPGYGLYETQVRDSATGRVRNERRWMKDRDALHLNATPIICDGDINRNNRRVLEERAAREGVI